MIIACLSLFMTVSLTGCGSSSKEDADTTQKENETEQTETEETQTAAEPKEISSRDQVYKTGDTVISDEYEFTLTEAEYVDAFSIQPDDTFLQKTDADTPPEDYQWLIYNVDYRYIGSSSNYDMGMFAVDEYLVGNNGYGSDFVCAFRKAGENWIVSKYSPFFVSFSNIISSYSSDMYKYEPSDQMYQARGALRVKNDTLTDEPLIIDLEHYKFEISR